MFEYSIRSKYTGEHDIIFGYSLAGALRDAGLSDEEWECYHVYDSFEEERVWYHTLPFYLDVRRLNDDLTIFMQYVTIQLQ